MDELVDKSSSLGAFLALALAFASDLPEALGAEGGDFNASLNGVLSRVGELLSASHAYVMLDEADGNCLRRASVWVGRGMPAAPETLGIYNHETDIPSLKPMLAGQKFLRGQVRDMPEDVRGILEKRGVTSVMLAPLVRNGVCIGMIGIDHCAGERRWRDEEGNLLRLIADMLVFMMDRRELHALRRKVADICATLGQEVCAAGRDADSKAERNYNAPTTLRESERRIITETLQLYNGNKLRAAKHLGLTWPALDRRCKKLGIMVKKKY